MGACVASGVYCKLFIYLMLLVVTLSTKPEFWVEDLLKTGAPSAITVRHHRLGRNYLRGFPRSSWGSVLFPVLPIVPYEELPDDYYTPLFEDLFDSTQTAEESYKAFREAVKKKFCTTDDKVEWKCCQPNATKSDCETVPTNAKNLMHSLRDPLQGMPLFFLYQWCTKGWAKHNDLKDENEKKAVQEKLVTACPDPCVGNPCRRIPLVNNTSICKVTGSFENDFTCDCQTISEWDPNLLTCRRKNPCLNERYPPCVANNTLRCVALDDLNVKCICKDEFMGEDCSLKRNACLERLNKSRPTGNENCRVQLGNGCLGYPGTDAYNCTCKYGFEPLLTMSEDNCLARRDPCQAFYAIDSMNKNAIDISQSNGVEISESEDWAAVLNGSNPEYYTLHRGITCLNGGQCITSADMTRAVCICLVSSEGFPLYTGPNCEIPMGTWSAWSYMSPCLPRDCGQTRYRWRRRRCLNTTSREDLIGAGNKSRVDGAGVLSHYSPPIRCIGTSEEVLPCDPLEPCMVLRLPGYMRGEILNYGTLYYFAAITAAYIIISFLSWYVFATPILNALEKKKRKPAAVIIHRPSPSVQ